MSVEGSTVTQADRDARALDKIALAFKRHRVGEPLMNFIHALEDIREALRESGREV